MRRVDAHHHLWSRDGRDYPFLASAGLEPLRRDYRLSDLIEVARASGIEATVLVQALPDVGESAELLEVASRSEGVVGAVVGWVDLCGDVPTQLGRLRGGIGGTLLRGVRHPAQAELDPAWLARTDVRRGVAAVHAGGLCFDLLVKEPQWPAALRLVQEAPGAVVLDHAGNPPIAAGDLSAWRRWVGEIAAAGPHVHVKLSGLVTLADRVTWTVADLRPVVSVLLEEFGAARTMAGSDWPICELAAPVEEVWRVHENLLGELSHDERAQVLGGTAARFYSIASLEEGAGSRVS